MTFEPFETPDAPPQFESEDLMDIRAIMEGDVPTYDESMAAELLHHVKSSIAVRAALKFALVKAREEELKLRVADTMDDVRRSQGAINFAILYFESLINTMQQAQNPDRSQDDELEE